MKGGESEGVVVAGKLKRHRFSSDSFSEKIN